MEIKVGQVYTFNDGETYDVINNIGEDGRIWYQIWQIKDLTYWDEKTKSRVVWSKAMPNNEGIVVDIEVMTKQEFTDLFNKGVHGYGYDCNGKLLGEMNKDFGLNDKWHLVPIDKSTKKWKPMEDK